MYQKKPITYIKTWKIWNIKYTITWKQNILKQKVFNTWFVNTLRYVNTQGIQKSRKDNFYSWDYLNKVFAKQINKWKAATEPGSLTQIYILGKF